MKITVYVASAFSKNQQGGNKAGVVLFENTLSPLQKMAIAKELGYAETVFITKSEMADYQFEYFTPKEEVDLCGHATIAAFVILKHLNKVAKDHYTIETNSGVLAITLKEEMIFMEQNQPQFFDIIPLQELIDCFDTAVINPQYPIQIVSTGLKDILIAIQSETALMQLEPNFKEIKAISERYDVVGFHLYTFDNERIICRNFAPRYDINEEAATGTSNCALACYLHTKHHIQKPLYRFEQGYSLNSPSEISVELITTPQNDIEQVFVGGKGYYTETKSLELIKA